MAVVQKIVYYLFYKQLQRRHEQMKKSLEQQISELEEKRRAYEQEKQVWEHSNNVTLEELRRRSLEASSKEWVWLQS